MGAGAVGCYYGFKLARAGHDVVLIGRPQHVEAIERQGLRLETQTFDEHIRVSASTEGSAVQGAQLVLFCVKSTDTDSGAAAIRSLLAPDVLVLSATSVVGRFCCKSRGAETSADIQMVGLCADDDRWFARRPR
jgi:2-dehydropantoate 2-reductase